MSDKQEARQFHSTNLVGEVLGKHYILEEKVGQGGMAWVYRARHQLLGGNVAVKVLFPQLAENDNIRTRFLREATLQYQLEHPHIVRVLDFIDERGLVGFVSEWCSGGDLVDWMEREGYRPLSPGEIRSLFLPVLDAAHVAHQHDVVHRDLKPHNIMLHQRGELLHPKITDFGIAKQANEQGLTATGMVVGTVHYMSPEQLYESKSVDLRSDVYSLGVILYQMIAGRLPFVGEAPGIFMRILEGSPPKIANIPPQVQAVLDKCLAKRADDRFADCMELRAALNECLGPPEPIVPVGQLVTDAARQQALAGLNSSISGVLYDGPSQAGWRPNDIFVATPENVEAMAPTMPPDIDPSAVTTAYEPLPDPSKQPKRSWLGLLVFFILMGSAAGGGWWWWQQQQKGTENPPIHRVRLLVRNRPPVRNPVLPRREGPVEPASSDAGPPEAPAARRRTIPDARPRTRPRVRVRKRPRPRRRVVVRKRPRPRRRGLARDLKLVKKCKRGVALACYILGLKEERKPHWAIDYREARRFYRRACRRNVPKACISLGRLYLKGLGGKRSYRRARYVYRRACRGQEALGCRELGWLLQNGQGGAQNRAGARLLYQGACRGGDSISCNLLGKMFQQGNGALVNHRRALFFYRKACALKNKVGCYNIGVMYRDGLSVFHNLRRAYAYFQRSCTMGFGQSCSIAADTLYNIAGERSCRQINRLLRQACSLKYKEACRKTCSSYNKGRPRSRSWLEDSP
ncbi:MAG: hypothetical protein EP343_06140 [Deltaproteobacteria bacterium]|nr:MAG: hypothetical protein EP343_06140 [Deltaproteobacteria bacterium]